MHILISLQTQIELYVTVQVQENKMFVQSGMKTTTMFDTMFVLIGNLYIEITSPSYDSK